MHILNVYEFCLLKTKQFNHRNGLIKCDFFKPHVLQNNTF